MSNKFNYKWNLSDSYPAPGIEKHGCKVFSTFACGGGSTMGYKLAGFDVIGANDIDKKMAEVYKLNHNPKHYYLESITTLKNRNFPDEFYNLHILDGSPPCSSFSMAGNREKDWGKEKKFREGQADQVLDTLFFDFIELGKKLQPKVIVAENVKGLLLGDAIQYVRKIYDDFDKAGYYCQHWLLDASKMGVPQRRERVFFIALRKDLSNPFMYRKDLFTTVPKLVLEFNDPKISFKYIKNNESRKELTDYQKDYWAWCIKNNESDFGKNAELTTNKRKNFNHQIQYDDDVSFTITGACNLCIQDTPHYLNDKELINIGSFPEDYNYNNNKVEYLIGMSVPPVMMAQVAHQIYLQWLSKL